MDIPQFIRDNTNDGRDILTFLIEAMNGDIDGCKLDHRLTAARLLVVYGHEDAPDFIADNTTPRKVTRDKQWWTIDPALQRLIRLKTDDGRDICRFLIEVMQGHTKGTHAGHRVSAARELLSRAFGKTPSSPLPKPKRQTRHTGESRYPEVREETKFTPDSPPIAPREAPTTSTAVLAEPEQDLTPEEQTRRQLLFDLDNDPRYTIFDSEIYDFMCECDDPDFDPYLAAVNEDYFKSYTACKDSECEVHGRPLEVNLDPNDHHY